VKFDNQLRHATSIIDTYKGEMPLHAWLKSFFRDNKQMGSRDRKLLSSLVYGYYRLGHAIRSMPTDERIITALFLCGAQPGDFLQYFRDDWNERITLPLAEKIAFFQSQPEGADFRITDIFPWKDELSLGIDHEAFCLSFLRQPDLFLRIRPGYKQVVLEKLAAIPHEFIPPFTVRLPNGFNVEDHFTPDHEVVVQDYSSQRIASFFPGPPTDPALDPPAGTSSPIPPALASFWDACAASGGKSILAHDLYPDMAITVSDVRESILHNLKGRFHAAGIKKYEAFVVDLTRENPPDPIQPSLRASASKFDRSLAATADLILADVPCTGSGTWGRTPEELCFFNPAKILRYSTMQQQILTHIAPNLAPGAWLIYSTCSVFKKENEDIAAFLRENFGLEQDKMENIKGYDLQADTMFAARFRR
jgi:16S rRNA (cytosine967-C5)-methyltransferase